MELIILNGKKMTSKEVTHTYLKQKLSHPDYHGSNLDALFDVLSTYNKPIKIILINEEDLIKQLGDYGNSLLQVFHDSIKENPNIKFETIKEEF